MLRLGGGSKKKRVEKGGEDELVGCAKEENVLKGNHGETIRRSQENSPMGNADGCVFRPGGGTRSAVDRAKSWP